MTKLGVNIDHVATVRQARRGTQPDLLTGARLALQGGADGITIHLREDRRHIQDADVRAIRTELDAHLNLEMALAPDVMDVAVSVVPDQATLVPERREELTTEGGLDVVAHASGLAEVTRKLIDAGVGCVSMFIEPRPEQIDASVRIGAHAIEIHTGAYANATDSATVAASLAEIRRAADYGAAAGVRVFAGHGLDYDNVGPVAAVEPIEELNIGHAIVSRAIEVGLVQAVAQMKALLKP